MQFSLWKITPLSIALAAWAAGTALQGSTFLAMSGEDLVDSSVAVVEGTVTAVRSTWNEERTAIHTYSDVEIDRVVVGEAPRVLTVRTAGGEADGIRIQAIGAPELRRDQRVLLFVRFEPDGSARITGYQQGQYTIVPGPQGRDMAISELRADTRLVEPGEPVERLPAVLALADLEARIIEITRRAPLAQDQPPVR